MKAPIVAGDIDPEETVVMKLKMGITWEKVKCMTTIPDKIFGTKWSDPVKLDGKEKFAICICVFLTAIGKL